MVHFRTIVQQHTNYYQHKSMLFPEITAVKMVFKLIRNKLGATLILR